MVLVSSVRRDRHSPWSIIRVGIACFAIGLVLGLLGSDSSIHVDEPLLTELPLARTTSTTATTAVPEQNLRRPPVDVVGDNVDESNLSRPNWKVSLDCSIFSLDCQIRRQYDPYPFNFWNSTNTKVWSEKKLNETPAFSTKSPPGESNQPQPVSKQLEKECLAYAKGTPFDQQLDDMLKKLSRSLNHVAYTMSDIAYAKHMIHDVFAMAHNVVGFPDSFFMVAIDDATVELGCRYGYPVLPSPQSGHLENRVKLTKFQVSFDLLQRGQDFLFFEMDVWFFRSMLPLIQNQFGDMLCSSHQNAPLGMNIGVYAVTANNATREYFQHCLDVAVQYDIHDQKLMQQLQVVSTSQRERQRAQANFPNVTFTNHIFIETLGSHEVASSEWPRLTPNTIAIHPLSSRPLMGPHGKMQIAKELGVYYGSHGYYSSKGRYLWLDQLDNSYSMVMNFQHIGWGTYHDGRAMKWTMATLIALAKRTNRIWVLPKIQADIGRHFLWKILDMEVVEDLGVEVRESSFLNNPKLSEFPSVSRTAIGERKMFWQEDAKMPQVWQLEKAQQLDSWFSLIDGIESNALLVNPHVIDRSWPDRFASKGRRNADTVLTPVEKEVYDVYVKLKWCTFDCRTTANDNCHMDWSSEFWKNQRLSGASAAHDCYGKGTLTDAPPTVLSSVLAFTKGSD